MKKQAIAVALTTVLCYSPAASADLIGTLLVNLAAKIFMDDNSNDSNDSKASAESRKQAVESGAEGGGVESTDKRRIPDSTADKAD